MSVLERKHAEPTDSAPFFLCGRYTLEGYEECVYDCKKRPKGSVQCGGGSCYCHYASSTPLDPDVAKAEKALESSSEDGPESRALYSTKALVNHIRASYCGRAPPK